MKQGDVIYKNGMELLVVLSYDHEEPCRGCFFYKDKKCGSERLIKCWNCNKEYIFTVIRENDTTELDKMIKRHKEAYENRLFKKYACRDWDGRGSTQWKSFPTQSPICRGNDGLPFNVDNLTIPYGKWRKESIKAYGNAIVPLIAVKIFEMINKIEGYEQQTTL